MSGGAISDTKWNSQWWYRVQVKRLFAPSCLKGIVQVEFELPSIAPFLVEIKVEVVWSDWQRAGLKFRYMSPEARQRFGDRLSVLETRGASVKRCLFIAALSGDDQAYSRFVLPQSESSQCARFVRTVENSSAGRFHAA
jgi:hypothetical protein